MSHNITVEGGTSVRLPTAGKYCDRDIVITAEGGGITLDDIVTGAITGDLVLAASAINAYSLAYNAGITSVSAPNATSVGTYAFYSCANIAKIDMPQCTSIGDYAFRSAKVTELNLPELLTLGNNALNIGGNLTELSLPKCTTIGNSCLGAIAVTKLILPECTYIGNSTMTGSKTLTYVDLPKCTRIVNYGLRNNSKLATLIIRSETVCALNNYALNTTAIWSGKGYVYVPSALVASYQAATNWKRIYATNANAFRALEDYTVDGTITGELDESKI